MSGTTETIAIGATVEGYFAEWNEADRQRRRAIIAATRAAEAGYVDPLFAAVGYDALDAMVVAVHERFPGYRFRLTEAIDAHRDRARWGWELAGGDGDPRARRPTARRHRLFRPIRRQRLRTAGSDHTRSAPS